MNQAEAIVRYAQHCGLARPAQIPQLGERPDPFTAAVRHLDVNPAELRKVLTPGAVCEALDDGFPARVAYELVQWFRSGSYQPHRIDELTLRVERILACMETEVPGCGPGGGVSLLLRRVVVRGPGGYERLEIEGHPKSEPGPGEVRISVKAAGVNYADCVVRMGLYSSASEYVGWPITPGFEVAGTVSAVGEEATGLPLGTPVIAVTRFGGYATELIVPRRQVFHLPPSFSMAQGATFPAVFLTAYYALFELAHPRPGARILVHSAAGGVGGALVQLARRAGAHVVGVVGSAHKVEAALDLGADAVIDKSSEPLWKTAEKHAPDGYHVVLDANGAETLKKSYAHLAPTGKLVVYGFHSMLPKGRGRPSWLRLLYSWLRTPRFDPLEMTDRNRSVLAFNLSYLFDRSDLLAEAMETLLGWALEGTVRPLEVTEFAFEKVAEAHRALESGNTVGKLVLLT